MNKGNIHIIFIKITNGSFDFRSLTEGLGTCYWLLYFKFFVPKVQVVRYALRGLFLTLATKTKPA